MENVERLKEILIVRRNAFNIAWNKYDNALTMVFDFHNHTNQSLNFLKNGSMGKVERLKDILIVQHNAYKIALGNYEKELMI